ncbi:MAG: PEP-CTERM sorting domain-containing protein [Thiobacillus sp.]|nr:PEP-CTERM sorting domain-containing protein [Thiobacillus sp.]
MTQRISIVTLAIAATFTLSHAYAAVIYDSGALAFESSGQSMWDSGTAFRKEDSVFLGPEWTNKTATIGGIAGSANEEVFPAIGAITIPVFEPSLWHPTPTWSNPLKGYWTGCNCWKDVTIKPATGPVTVDTRTGAELKVHTSGKVGLEFGYAIDSGSVDTTANFQALAELPDLVQASEFFSINTSSIFDNGTIKTQSPKAEAYISEILQLSGSIDAQACALTFGCVNGSKALPSINVDQRILSIDPNSLKILDGIMPGGDAFAEVAILNRSLTLEGGATTTVPPVPGFKLTTSGLTLASSLPPGIPAVTVDLAELTVFVPDIATTGTGSGVPVTSSGRDDLLSLQLDLDAAASLFGGVPPLGGNFDLFDAGPIKLSVSFDLIDVDAGPVLGITQDFEFTPTLMVDLAFSKPVQIAGLSGPQNSWSGLWSDLPDLDFAIEETTTFTPTFWLDALLKNDMGLDLGLVGTLDLLKLGATASVGGFDLLDFNSLSLNNLLGIGNTLFKTPKVGFSVYDTTFELGGFNRLAGTPFTLSIGTQLPGSGTAGDAQVPEPGTVGLLLAGLLAGLQLGRRSRVSARSQEPLFG